GGGIYNNGNQGNANGTFTDCTFEVNFAKIGAAVYLNGDDGTARGQFEQCAFISNSANDNGGAVGATAIQGDAKTFFTDCTFDHNHARILGGAVWNHGASPHFITCNFQRNSSDDKGGAMYNDGANGTIANPRLTSCEFTENTAVNQGGAMYNQATFGDASPLVVLTKFIANGASSGGAIYNDCGGNSTAGQLQAVYYNCLFSRNNCVGRGAVAYNIANGGSCTPAFASCSFAGNTAGAGSLFYLNQLNGGTCTVNTYNMASHGHTGSIATIIGGATVQAYGGMYEAGLAAVCNNTCYPGVDPLFTNPTADDLTLQPGSPAINVGLNAWYLPQYPLDLAGNTRLQGGTIDLGAYETASPPPCPRVIYVNKIAAGANDGTNWANAYRDLQDALAEARVNPCTDTILIAEGVYKPTTTTNVNIGFELVNDIEMYGGFPNTGNPWFPDRDLIAHETILSGDIGVQGITFDNSLGVITVGGLTPLGPTNVNNGTIVDGLSIIKGVTGYLVTMYQNSIRCETVFRDVRFYDNYSRLLRAPAIHIFIPNTATYAP
ncbi:MAG TPA: choice-of-anchor Q domain-containing protein, partial [Bacteroidia bacterium]|nr:choice-of-anchor Q domain-containing protein [Bacteroidia bacterium]